MWSGVGEHIGGEDNRSGKTYKRTQKQLWGEEQLYLRRLQKEDIMETCNRKQLFLSNLHAKLWSLL